MTFRSETFASNDSATFRFEYFMRDFWRCDISFPTFIFVSLHRILSPPMRDHAISLNPPTIFIIIRGNQSMHRIYFLNIMRLVRNGHLRPFVFLICN